jgi:hypothetical protein
MNTQLLAWKQAAQRFGLFLKILQKLPKVNSRPIGKNSAQSGNPAG